MKAVFAGYPLLNSLVKIALLTGSLELGFVTGLISTDISAAVQGFRGFGHGSAAQHRRAQPI